MPRFREYNPLMTALIGTAVVAVMLFAAFTFPSLPFVRGTTYKALFTEGGGMKISDEVRVAGTRVGKVIGLELVGDKVQVTFTAGEVRMGDGTTAAIKTGTLLGKRYLSIVPGGGPDMEAGDTIPVSRTAAPYNITTSIESLSAQIRDFDKPKIEAALDSFSGAFKDTPENLRETMQNVKALARTVNTRDQALRELLGHANQVSAVLNDRREQFRQILSDGNLLMAEIQRRKDVIEDSLRGFSYAAHEAKVFAAGNDEELHDTLAQLNRVLDILKQHNHDLSVALQRVSGFANGLGEGVGNAPTFLASVNLGDPGEVFHYTDLLRQVYNPQLPRVPSTPGLPGYGPLPNPLNAPPSGAETDPKYGNPEASGPNPFTGFPTLPSPPTGNTGSPSLPLIGGK